MKKTSVNIKRKRVSSEYAKPKTVQKCPICRRTIRTDDDGQIYEHRMTETEWCNGGTTTDAETLKQLVVLTQPHN